VLDGLEGKLTNAKWAALGKCSADTALRDINDLLARGVLRRLEGGGRSTGYEISTRYVATRVCNMWIQLATPGPMHKVPSTAS
jgi:DeoR/GlpR family transcriptional regulator of sugar metabolism